MTPNRFAKRLARRLRVSWRDEPSQHDIEALEENVGRVGLVIRVRWTLVVALAAFSVLATAIYAAEIPFALLARNMVVPGVALVFVLGYNTFYQVTYRRLGNIAVLNHAQLLFDVLVVTVLVYYSGGVYSWFYAMYALMVLEAAFIFRGRWQVWMIAGAAIALYGLVVGLDYARVLPHVGMPFVNDALQGVPAYVAVRFLWVVTLLSGTAAVSRRMTGIERACEAELAAVTTRDAATGLHDRAYFRAALGAEVLRARSWGSGLAAIMVDIDRFGEFNRLFGLDAGNRMLRRIAELLVEEARDGGRDRSGELHVIARFGGEEFAILVPRPTSGSGALADGLELAERVRGGIGRLRVDDMGVTVSVGVGAYPADGATEGELMSARDQAVALAASRGGNRVVSAAEARAEAAE